MISIALAGTTHHTVRCAQALLDSGKFTIPWILTPVPKPIGRKKILTKNPLHQWAENHRIPIIFVEKKIDATIHSQLHPSNFSGKEPDKVSRVNHSPPDFLLVVDFGYLIPHWLLDLPTIAPLNIHPSRLPAYRGSSPAQFALLYGEKTSAVTVMKMSAGLDTGDILRQIPFTISPDWDSAAYYHHAFELVTRELPEIIENVVKTPAQQRQTLFVPQPENSPTPIARRLTKEDGFIPWGILLSAMTGETDMQIINIDHFSPLLRDCWSSQMPNSKKIDPQLHPSNFSGEKPDKVSRVNHSSLTTVVANATRALSPWPHLWTIVPTTKGEKRMKILEIEANRHPELDSGSTPIVLKKVQIEGSTETTFEEVKNQITS